MSKEKVREFYVNYHKKKGKYGRKTGGKERVGLLREFIGTGKKVLDLGCRDGNFTKFYMDGNEVIGTDIDDVALEICSRELGIKTYHVDLNDDFPFKDASFDAVVAGEIIEHLMMPEHFIQEIQRILKTNGVFCGTTPNAYRLLTKINYILDRPLCADPSHLHFFSYDSLKNLLLKYFREVDIIPFHGHIIGSNKFGIPVKRNSSITVGKLFSRHFLWKAVKK